MRASDKGKEGRVRKKPGRTPTSCAECRRLKLRCDRNVPCEKCVSRGCGEICPNGILAAGKGNRMVLSGTEELHDRIDHLCARIRELEAALRTLQERVSEEPHPLLRTDELQPPPLRAHSQQEYSSASASSSSNSAVSQVSPTTSQPPINVSLKLEDDNNTIDAFGTLTIAHDGASKYIGKTARSEFLISALIKPEPEVHTPSRLPEAITHSPFPEFDLKQTYLKEQVYKMLPPLSEALRLCDIYLDHAKHLYAPVPRTELLDEILTPVQRTRSYESFHSYHTLALLFSVFAVASHFDPHKEAYSIEAREYYQLARASLGFASPVRQTTLASIQTLIHMAQYLDLSDWECTGSESAWIYIGHAVRLGFSVGLHLNPPRWKLPDKDVNRRSRVFWQLFVLDTWTSFYFGRPPSISPCYVDCSYPRKPNDFPTPGSATVEPSFHSWNYHFTMLLNSVMASGMGPKQPVYSTILDLDRQIRDFQVPEPWRATTEQESPRPSPETHMYRWLVLASKEITLLNLHRAFFAQALHESPYELQKHRYFPSLVAIYRSSWRLMQGLQLAWNNAPDQLARVNVPWSQALSAAIVLCLLVTKAPSSHLTNPALEKLDALLSLFRSASASCRSAANLLSPIQSLCQKAYHASDPRRSLSTSLYPESPITHIELDRLSGKTHLFSDSATGSPSTPFSHEKYSNRSRSTSVTLSDTPEGFSDSVHPILAQDLKDFRLRNVIPSIPTLSDFGSDSPTTTPTREPSFPPPPSPSPAPPPLLTVAPAFVPGPSSLGFSTEFQHYYESLEVRRSSIIGFVSPFEPPPHMLDGSWQSFVEQLGF